MGDFTETSGSTSGRLEVGGVIPGASPEEVYRAFTDAALLARWWGDEADVDPVVGGRLVVHWPAMEWTFRGIYTELDRGRAVGFTWSWDHEPDTPTRTVRVTFEPARPGTLVEVSHGDYGPDDADERRGHLEGWRFFLDRIAALVAT
jgi:uncharacterized protein YndB with AHSA1/START domain